MKKFEEHINNIKNKYYTSGEIVVEEDKNFYYISFWDNRAKFDFTVSKNEAAEFLNSIEYIFEHFDFSFYLEGDLKSIKDLSGDLKSIKDLSGDLKNILRNKL